MPSPFLSGRRMFVVLVLCLLVLFGGSGVTAAVGPDSGTDGQHSIGAVAVSDPYEPNDGPDSAPNASGELTGALNDSDVDWFAVNLSAGEPLTLAVVADNGSVTSLDVDLLSPSEIPVDTAVEGDVVDGEVTYRLAHEAFSTGTYYVRIRGDVDGNVTYTMDVNRPDDGGNEPNENRANATALDPGVTESASLVGDEHDFYNLTLDANEIVSVTVESPKSGFEPTVELVEPSGNTVSVRNESRHFASNATFRLGREVDRSGTYYVRVSGVDVESSVPYTLSVDVVSTEENYDFPSATEITPRLYTGLESNDPEDDFYQMDLQPGETINATFTLSRDEDPDIRLVNPEGDVVDVTENRTTVSDSSAIYRVAYETSQSDYKNYDPVDTKFYLRFIDRSAGNVEYQMDVRASRNDRYEPNGNSERASLIDPGTYRDLTILSEESDYFAVELEEGEPLHVTVWNRRGTERRPVPIQPRVELYAPDGSTVLDTSEDANDRTDANTSLRIGHEASSTGTYYVRVYGEDVETTVSYSMDIAVAANDRYEPNGNVQKAKWITPGTYDDLTALSDENDYYAIRLDAGETIDVNATNLKSKDNENFPSIDILNPSAETVDSGERVSTGSDDLERHRVAYEAETDGIHYVRVYGQEVELPVNYTMDVAVAANDRYEPNGNVQKSTPLSPGRYEGLTVLSQEEDYYAVRVRDGETIDVNVRIPNADGEEFTPTVELRRPDATVVDRGVERSTGSDNSTRIRVGHEADTNGTYYVVVAGRDDETSVEYSIDVAVAANDRYEPNGNVRKSTPIDPGTYESLTLLSQENDYYALDLQSGQTLNVTVSHNKSEEISPRLDVFGPGGERLDTGEDRSTGAENFSRIRLGYEAESNGTYYVRVYGEDIETTVAYSMTVGVDDNDRYEPNGNFQRATELSPGSYEGISVLSQEEDYYAVELQGGETIDVSLSNEKTEAFTPSVELYRADGTRVDTGVDRSTDADNFTRVRLGSQVESNGTYYVRVAGQNVESTVEYTMNVSVGANDRYEPNGKRDVATRLEPGSYEGLRLLSEESDIYAIHLDADESLTLQASHDKSDAFAPTVELYSPGGTRLVRADDESNAVDSRSAYLVEYTASEPGRFFVVIEGEDVETAVDYTLSVEGGSLPTEKPPTARFELLTEDPSPGERLQFDASSSVDPNRDALTYSWDVDGDGTADATGPTPSITFDRAGKYTVSLTVEDATGRTDFVEKTITVGSLDVPAVISRSPSMKTVSPGDNVSMRTRVRLNRAADRLVVTENGQGGFLGFSDVNAYVEGEGSVVSTTTSLDVLTVTAEGLEDGDIVAVEYVFTVSEDPDGSTLNLSGSLQTETAFESTPPLSFTVSDVDEGTDASAYAGSDGVVDTDELRRAISDWVGNEVSTSLLRRLITYWVTGETVS